MKFESTYVGKKEIGYNSMLKQNRIRLLSSDEMLKSASLYSKFSNLGKEQVALNNFGFPFIPKPFPRIEYGYLRNAPEGVSKSFFGHPIYWIDPELTKKRDTEHDPEWSIRMFCLIDAFGYWNEDLSFIDFLKIQGFDFSNANISIYFDNSDQECVTDSYKLLDEEDLVSRGTSLQEVEDRYQQILLDLFAIQDRESVLMLKRQFRAVKFTESILGDQAFVWSASFDDSGHLWDNKIFPLLIRIDEIYDKRAREENMITTDLLKQTRKVEKALQETVRKMRDACTHMELPLHAHLHQADIEKSEIKLGIVASTQEILNRKNILRDTVFNEINDVIREVLAAGNQGEGAYRKVIQAFAEVYEDAWNRMRFMYVNYTRLKQGKPLYATNSEMISKIREDTAEGYRAREDEDGFINTKQGLSGALQEFDL